METTPPTDLAAELGKQNGFACLQEETYLNLVRTHEPLQAEFARFFKSHGISDAQYNALRILRGAGRPLQVYQIAEQMISQQTDISRLIHRLHAADLIRRERCSEDRRVVWVQLTDKAKRLLKKMDQPLRQLHASQFPSLSSKELKTLNDLLFKARQAAGS
ncbi:MarR family winged helix-turn-helix transcriptional regulator [Roseimaritima ulvae]|uniref:HTH-type transcriptional regulator MgrA n=1 Tax=Roseimaritima ulvae TaxID=980254 RepID=A0A5B9QJB1_9BACT|nr:MarR family transcriptional regulator [Roseimaritima ulvae]QEG39197.1 HTH-type transcriptional regulator MgrA [Roseimaritima ulvae]